MARYSLVRQQLTNSHTPRANRWLKWNVQRSLVVLALSVFLLNLWPNKSQRNTGALQVDSAPMTTNQQSFAAPVVGNTVGAMAASTSGTVPGTIPGPPPDEATLEHPRLFFAANDLVALRAEAASTHQEIWQPIQAFTDSQLATSPPQQPPDGAVEDDFRNFGNRLIAFAFTCLISDRQDYCDFAKQYLLAYAGWNEWDEANQRDLGLAHMLMGSAIAYDWLYDRLTPDERTTVRTSLADWAQKMYEASSAAEYDAVWHNWWRQSYAQNHFWTDHSALGMAGLALLNDDSRAADWINQAAAKMTRVQFMLNSIADGSWHEGLAYQHYGLTMSLPFLVNLQRLLGTDLLPHRYLHNYIDWSLYNMLPNSTAPILAYGDFDWSWGNSYQPQNILRFLAHAYGDGRAEWLAQQIIAADGRIANEWAAPWYVFEFLYYDPTIQAQPPDGADLAQVFPDLAAVIWRTGWGKNDLVFGFKTGAYGGRFNFNAYTNSLYPWELGCSQTGCQLNAGHDHDDNNTFYLYRAGAWLAPETVGVGATDSSYHNTLLIDNQGQYRPPTDFAGKATFVNSDAFLETTGHSANFAYLAANATRCYKQIPGLIDVTRHVLFIQPDYFLMVDHVAATDAHQYEWVSHFGKSVQVKGNWVRGNAGNDQILGVGIVAPQDFQATTADDGQPYVHIGTTNPVKTANFINLLYPTTKADWQTRPQGAVLADNDQALLVQVQRQNDSHLIDDLLITYGAPQSDAPQTRRNVGGYEFDSAAAVIVHDAGQHVRRLFLHNGSYLADQNAGNVLVENNAVLKTLEADYDGDTVNVTAEADAGANLKLFAPNTKTLVVNGRTAQFTQEGDYIHLVLPQVYLPILSAAP